MAEPKTIRVFAVPGKLVPHPVRRNQYVGYRFAREDETPDVSVRNGKSYVLLPDGEMVPAGFRMRVALRKGALSTKSAAKAPKKVAKSATTKEG